MSYKSKSPQVFAQNAQAPLRGTSVAYLHAKVRVVLESSLEQHQSAGSLGFPTAFVLHSLRHTFCTRLGEAGTEAFLIQRLAGHHSVTVSERYVHPRPEPAVLAIRRLDAANRGGSRKKSSATRTATNA